MSNIVPFEFEGHAVFYGTPKTSKVGDEWKMLRARHDFARIYDTGKKHGSGASGFADGDVPNTKTIFTLTFVAFVVVLMYAATALGLGYFDVYYDLRPMACRIVDSGDGK